MKRSTYIRRGRIPPPLPPEEATQLEEYEAILHERMDDFVQVGKVLTALKHTPLPRKYFSFLDYCEKRWMLARRTVYQKLQVYRCYQQLVAAHTAAGTSSTFTTLPTSESQIRMLLTLRPHELRIAAWAYAESLASPVADIGNIPVAIIEEAVDVIRRQHGAFPALLKASRIFCGIPWQLDVYRERKNPTRLELLFQPNRLLMEHGAPVTTVADGKTPLVLVSPHVDLFQTRHALPPIDDLLQVLFQRTEYHFLLWTADASVIARAQDWPAHLELAIYVNETKSATQLTRKLETGEDSARCAMWVNPIDSVAIPTVDAFTRILVGACAEEQLYTEMEVMAVRQLLVTLLQSNRRLHLSQACRQVLTYPCDDLPDRLPPAVSQKIVDAIHWANTT